MSGSSLESSGLDVSVVLPCLNEAATIATAVLRCGQALEDAGLRGEIIVVDNGSTDGSRDLAVAVGARIVVAPERGYGNALYHGIAAASAELVVFLDSDLSYECGHIPAFVAKLRQGYDLVMGSRFKGTIDPGAMRASHRYLGTPVLTGLVNLFYGCRLSDINCGMRGIRGSAFRALGLKASGMEFASEMVIKAARLGLRIAEIPTDLHKDQRGRRPHLRSLPDGWRHLRFILLFCPTWLFLVPGLLSLLFGSACLVAVSFGTGPTFGVLTSLLGLSLTVLGTQILLLGIAAHGFTHLRRLEPTESRVGRFLSWLTLEKGILLGGGAAALGGAVLGWAGFQLRDLAESTTYAGLQSSLEAVSALKLALLGTTIFVTGAQVLFSSFFLGLYTIEPISRQPERPR